ncbi:3'-5' exonuclease [Anaerotignum propionicum]|uniref:3'-5' exonuclease n=1 Tax=Anaerotignum propionicum TaxID=28446 RepID=UPI00210C812D|nr:3'-5' exonuclease [Anaerotignum propionicum]MCQ4935231.1 ATP-binding domain-containing protein [Anaerotignum propionicum]
MIVSCLNRNEELEQIKAKLDSFLKSGAVSLGIILKTNSAAKEIYELLKHDYDIQHISMDSTHFGNGISVASVQMSKGLEFDEVIIPNVNEDVYCSNYDRGLLYVACTRAMHKLTLLYSKKPSYFLFSHLKESSDSN